MTDAAKLREVAQIAETHFATTFGTDRIAALHRAADALDAKDAEIEAAREALYTLVSHAALHEEYTSHPTDEDVVQISLGELRRARQALAALRALTPEKETK